MEIRLKKIILSTLILINSFLVLQAEVYWLRDVADKIKLSKNEVAELEGLLDMQVVFEDELIINGYRTTMDVGSSRYKFSEILRQLQHVDSKLISVIDSNSIVLTFKISDDVQRKYLISNLGNQFDAVVFAIKLPTQFAAPAWPDSWRNVFYGAKLDTVVEYPKRKATYITFSNVFNDVAEMNHIRSSLESKGFQTMSTENKSMNNLSEIFIKHDPQEIICVSFTTQSGGFVYQKIK